jgi:hypothetical protein
MFYFGSIQKTVYGAFDNQPEIMYLCPKDFDLVNWRVLNLKYRNTLNGYSDNVLAQKIEDIRTTDHKYVSYESFWAQ